jgi:hypothetical protein
MAIHRNDAYTWCAIYQDGTTIQEFDETNSVGRGFAEVDSAQVKALELQPVDGQHLPSRHVALPAGATPVFFRRRKIELDPNSNEQMRSTVHCIGWKRDDQAVYLFIHDDGSVLLTSDIQAV